MATVDAGPAGSVAQEAWELLCGLFQRNRAHMLAATAAHDLSPMQAQVLRLLEPDRAVPMSTVADQLYCDASNVTGIVDRLEARGLVERRRAAHDGRVRALALTAAGAEVSAAVHAKLREPPPVIANLSDEDQRTLADVLRRALEVE